MNREVGKFTETFSEMSGLQEQNNNDVIETKKGYHEHTEDSAVQTNDSIDSKLQSSPYKGSIEDGSLDGSNTKFPTQHERENQKSKYMKRHPWITEEFLKMVQQRDQLHLKLRNDSSSKTLRKEFAFVRNRTAALRRKLKLAYQTYLEEL